MVKIDIISGFLGAGKTTLIKKLLKEAFEGEQVVLIENEFGEIGIDGGFLKDAGIEIREMNSGCICCSLVGDFGASLAEVVEKYHPDRILIEPSGVGKLSDVIKAVQGVEADVDIQLNSYTTVVDAKKCKMYMRNFGEFFDNQVQYAGAIIMSRTDIVDEKKAMESMELLRSINEKAAIITTPIEKLDGKKILEVMEHPVSLADELLNSTSGNVVYTLFHDTCSTLRSDHVVCFYKDFALFILNGLAGETTCNTILKALDLLLAIHETFYIHTGNLCSVLTAVHLTYDQILRYVNQTSCQVS